MKTVLSVNFKGMYFIVNCQIRIHCLFGTIHSIVSKIVSEKNLASYCHYAAMHISSEYIDVISNQKACT